MEGIRTRPTIPPLVTLFGLLLLTPCLPGFLIHLVFLVALSIPAWLLTDQMPRARLVMKLLAAPVIIILMVSAGRFLGLGHFMEGPVTILALVFTVFFLLFCATLILAALISISKVSPRNILDTISLYLIIGFIWAYIYQFIRLLDDSAFRGNLESNIQFSDFIYYSFVTLTTLGYGDIAPHTPLAKTMAVTEAIIGQFYVAVVVTYLLTLFIEMKYEAGTGDRS
jgi:hypothetical protein